MSDTSDGEGETKIGVEKASEDLTGRERQIAALRPHQFKPGNGGRPKGAKNKFSEAFWRALADDFAQHGASTIERVRTEYPAKYLAACVNVLPKDLNVKHEGTDAFVQLWTLISQGTAEQALELARARESEGSEQIH